MPSGMCDFTKRVVRDSSSFDKMLVHLKLQTCFVLPELFSAIDMCRLQTYIDM